MRTPYTRTHTHTHTHKPYKPTQLCVCVHGKVGVYLYIGIPTVNIDSYFKQEDSIYEVGEGGRVPPNTPVPLLKSKKNLPTEF